MSPRVVIDSEGDIVLQLHQDQPNEAAADGKTVGEKLETRELIVSSKVLSLASPVFRVMISGKFKEGVELAEKTASLETYDLPLPEDDADATIVLCRVLHFSIKDVPEKPTTVCLEKLAYLCDKYQCINAMKYCGGLWLRNWLLVCENEDLSIDDLCRLLIFAYVVDLPYEFLGISWKLFLSHKGPFLGPFTQAVILVDHPLLHQNVAREMDSKRLQCCKSFHRGIMAPANWNWQTLTKNCYRAAKAVGTYFNSLQRAEILPYDLGFTEHRFCDLIRKASHLPYISVSQYTCSVYKCGCESESTYNLSSKLQEEARFIKQQQGTFICLDCLKTEEGSKYGGNCRISHS
ncbi:hypothetical protein BGZ60DRAFT_411902 [Tricladium varicosporioides]|nr:hypothetical protein BGZ60DRAFT_411902 [Hymenoscyphus varicosporioides]